MYKERWGPSDRQNLRGNLLQLYSNTHSMASVHSPFSVLYVNILIDTVLIRGLGGVTFYYYEQRCSYRPFVPEGNRRKTQKN